MCVLVFTCLHVDVLVLRSGDMTGVPSHRRQHAKLAVGWVSSMYLVKVPVEQLEVERLKLSAEFSGTTWVRKYNRTIDDKE